MYTQIYELRCENNNFGCASFNIRKYFIWSKSQNKLIILLNVEHINNAILLSEHTFSHYSHRRHSVDLMKRSSA